MIAKDPSAGDAILKELIIHIANASEKDEKFGAVKLNKILFYADFLSYLKRGHSITGQTYFALKDGPAPKRLLPAREEMKNADEIAIQRSSVFGMQKQREKVIALRSANYKILNDAEGVAITDFVIEKLRNKNGTDLTIESHNFIGWKMAFEQGSETTIPYSTARIDLKAFKSLDERLEIPELPQELVEHGKELYRKLFDA